MFSRYFENLVCQIKHKTGMEAVELFSRVSFISKPSSAIAGVEARTSIRIQSDKGEKQVTAGSLFPSLRFFVSAFSIGDWREKTIPMEGDELKKKYARSHPRAENRRNNTHVYYREWLINNFGLNIFNEGSTGFYEKNNMFFSEQPVFKEVKKTDAIILNPLQVYALLQAGVLRAFKKRLPVTLFHDCYGGTGGDNLTVYRGFRDISLKEYVFSVDVIKDNEMCGICVDDMNSDGDILHFNNNGLTVCSIHLGMIESFTRVSRFFVFESEGYLFSLPYLKLKGIFQWA